MARLHELSADALSAAYRARQVSPVEVTRAVLDRIEAWEPKIHAMYMVDAVGALAQATNSERRWRAGESSSNRRKERRFPRPPRCCLDIRE